MQYYRPIYAYVSLQIIRLKFCAKLPRSPFLLHVPPIPLSSEKRQSALLFNFLYTHITGMATTRLAHVSYKNNIQAVQMHTRQTLNSDLKYLRQKLKLICCSWMYRNMGPPYKVKQYFINLFIAKLSSLLWLSKLV